MTQTQSAEIAPELLIDHALAQVGADPRVQRALAELKAFIFAHYPQATFNVTRWTDPAGIYLEVGINAEDWEELVNVVIDLLLEIQVERQLPIELTRG